MEILKTTEGVVTAFNQVFKHLQEQPDKDFASLNSLENKENNPLLKEVKQQIQKITPPQYHQRIINELFGLGPIEDLFYDPAVTEIIINGKDRVLFEKEGHLNFLPDKFFSQLTFHNFIHRILESAGLTINLKKPFADGHWKGRRLHIIQAPLVNVDFHVSFRKHPKNPWTFERLKNQDWAPDKALNLIQKLLAEKSNILIAGPTSSGKTSVLNACLQFLPPTERIITIEDSSELIPPGPFSTKLFTRENNNNNSDTLLTINQNELVRQSLRMRPDRIIMGEARGPEAKDLLMALSTGHKGSLGTIHAKDHKQALWRLEMLVQMGAPFWDTNTIRQMIVLGIDHLIILGRYQRERTLMGIYKLSGVEKTGYLFDPLYTHLSLGEMSIL